MTDEELMTVGGIDSLWRKEKVAEKKFHIMLIVIFGILSMTGLGLFLTPKNEPVSEASGLIK